MNSKPGTKSGKAVKKMPSRRTPRTLKVDQNKSQLPAIIPEQFNLKNFDIIGKIDDMRSLTKELSIMARQLEQWVGIVQTVSMAFKDNGIFNEVVKSLSSIGNNMAKNQETETANPRRRNRRAPLLPPQFPFFGSPRKNQGNDNVDNYPNNNRGNYQDNYGRNYPDNNRGNYPDNYVGNYEDNYEEDRGYDRRENEEDRGYDRRESEGNRNQPNIFEIINNPAFKEIVSKLFLQKK